MRFCLQSYLCPGSACDPLYYQLQEVVCCKHEVDFIGLKKININIQLQPVIKLVSNDEDQDRSLPNQ